MEWNGHNNCPFLKAGVGLGRGGGGGGVARYSSLCTALYQKVCVYKLSYAYGVVYGT